jgi:hypothetical protein
MTNQNKLIVGAVVVLGAYYLYDRSKKMKAVSDLKAGAEVPATIQPMTSEPIKLTEIEGVRIERAENYGKKFSNFAGSRGSSMSAQYFR